MYPAMIAGWQRRTMLKKNSSKHQETRGQSGKPRDWKQSCRAPNGFSASLHSIFSTIALPSSTFFAVMITAASVFPPAAHESVARRCCQLQRLPADHDRGNAVFLILGVHFLSALHIMISWVTFQVGAHPPATIRSRNHPRPLW